MALPVNPKADHTGSQQSVEADEKSLRAHRLEDIGLLATRAAHDLNNMLTPMMIAIPILRPAVSDPAARGLLDSLETTIARATGLVRQILEYAHGDGGRFQPVLMRQLLEEITDFARETFPRTIRVEMRLPPDLWPVNANLSQLHQVLLNLCVNARDAMPQGGTLSLRAENCQLDAATAATIAGGRAGAFLVLQVDDTGTGVPPAVMAKMWEPFITTKKDGAGSGLGLSTIRDIILRHGGFIQLTTTAGRGSSFRIHLPAENSVGGNPGAAASMPADPMVNSSA